MAKVKERLDRAILYDVVETRPVLRALAMEGGAEGLKAIRLIEELAGNIKAGPRVVNTVNNVTPTTFEEMSDEQFTAMADEWSKSRGEPE